MIYTAMTTEGKKVEGNYVNHCDPKYDRIITLGFPHIQYKIIPSTLKIKINGKEYTVEEVVERVENAQCSLKKTWDKPEEDEAWKDL